MNESKKDQAGFFTDYLGQDEVNFSKYAAQELRSIPWAQKFLKDSKILAAINHVRKPGRSLTEIKQLKSAFFEIRFAYALHKKGLQPIYEYSAGVGRSRIDFNINSNPNWLIELTSLSEGEAVKSATNISEHGIATFFSETRPGEVSTEIVEIIRGQRAFCSKVANQVGKPIKFPKPTSNVFHMIILDARSFNAGISDAYDYWNITYGSKYLLSVDQGVYCRYWSDKNGNSELIKGLYDHEHPESNSKFIRENIHALGFIAETKFEDGFLLQNLSIMHNPLFFATREEFLKVLPKELQKK